MQQMFAPWRLAFIQGEAEPDVPSPSGCIFCDFPRPEGGGAPLDDGASPRAHDRRRLVVTARARAFVILNKYPYNNGHVMVVPRVHTSEVESLEAGAYDDLHALLRETIAAIRQAYRPHGINVGMNMGKAGGAGIEEHVHWHVVPRWNGDTNFMPVVFDTKVISESLLDTWDRLAGTLRRPEDDEG